MATTSKQRQLNQLFSSLDRQHQPAAHEARPVLEQFIYGICLEGASREQADQAYENLRATFYDWNEVRVSSTREIEETLGGLPDAEGRAQRLISFLQEVFEQTFSFDLESLHKKKGGVKQAINLLSRYQAASEHVVSWVVQRSLGGHAIPIDADALRASRRLGLIDPDQNDRAAQSSLEHLIPKSKGMHFTEQINYLAHALCQEEEPHCDACPLSSGCPTGRERVAELSTAHNGARRKAR